jgi:hypothetical protein
LNMMYDDTELSTQLDYIPKLPTFPDSSSKSVIVNARRYSSSHDSFSSYSDSDYSASDYSASDYSVP